MSDVVIEFVQDVFHEDDEGTVRVKGARLRVDAGTATSYVEHQKVAKYVDAPKVAKEPMPPVAKSESTTQPS